MAGGSYQFPVALQWHEGPDILKKIKNKILVHFQSKNKSNGGECEIRDLDCSRGYILIHFRDEAVRNKVLQKKPARAEVTEWESVTDERPVTRGPNTPSEVTPTAADSSAAVT
ncbi:protein mono-ADP-ribosyltransferase PARP14-like, partial [Dendropsophus ebraccatus]|uniref:protein mono-ADP-ribosyltransferase PARP14-like n=1 Tax=Dendropsophus ebraccatus TaxID=150705 RepID=UPI00383102AC